MVKCPTFKYSKNVVVIGNKGDLKIQPLPKDKKRIFDEIFRELKHRKCKTRWMPKTEYKESSGIYKAITGNKTSHTFQINSGCVEIANELEDRLEGLGITFDKGLGTWKDWELDYIKVCKHGSVDPIHTKLKTVERDTIRKLMIDYGTLR